MRRSRAGGTADAQPSRLRGSAIASKRKDLAISCPEDTVDVMSDTSERILDTAEALIQKGGFHGFSFQDIADEIGIKKASIYYHHPAKAALGREVIARYRRRFQEVMTAVAERKNISHWDALALYLEPIVAISRAEDRMCLCGVLGGEYLALPEEMRDEVAGFFNENQQWLAKLLERGRKADEFHFSGSPRKLARLIFSAIEGALLIKRATGDAKQFDEVTSIVHDMLQG